MVLSGSSSVLSLPYSCLIFLFISMILSTVSAASFMVFMIVFIFSVVFGGSLSKGVQRFVQNENCAAVFFFNKRGSEAFWNFFFIQVWNVVCVAHNLQCNDANVRTYCFGSGLFFLVLTLPMP